MPYEPDPGPNAPGAQRLAFQAFREVRHTVIRVITAHLQEDAEVSWQGLHFDLRYDGPPTIALANPVNQQLTTTVITS